METLNDIVPPADTRLGRELGIIGPYADVPGYQIRNDTTGKIRFVIGKLVTAEYGPRGERFKQHPRWQDLLDQAMRFQRRYDAHSGDAFYAHLLLQEVDAFRDGPMQQMLDEVNRDADA